MSHNAIHILSRAVIINESHILLCKGVSAALVKKGYWKEEGLTWYYLPGGHVDPQETVELALVRELKEEIGLDFEIKRFLGCFEYIFTPEEHQKMCHTHEYNFIFEAKADGFSRQSPLTQVEEHVALEWVALDRLKDIDFKPEPLKKLIPDWLKADACKVFQSKVD